MLRSTSSWGDWCNHRLFQPLLYQVATAALAPTEIAEPTRSILRNAPNVTVRLDEAIGVEPARRQILLRAGLFDPFTRITRARPLFE